MSALTVLGATGPTGRLVLARALEAGHQVKVLVRDAARIERTDGVEVVVGDATDAVAVRRALQGSAAVVSTLGSGRDASSRVASLAARGIVAAAPETGTRRVLVMSAFGVGDSPAQAGRVQRLITGAVMKDVFADKAEADDLLRASDLDWTVVLPVTLGNGPVTGRVRVVDLATGRAGVSMRSRISRADVATFLVDQIDDPAWTQRTVVLDGA